MEQKHSSAEKHVPTEKDLSDLKTRLKSGKLEQKDFAALEGLVKRTEDAARMLRAAVVE